MKKRAALVSSILLVIITLLALALRVYRLDAQSLWYDEGFSAYVARMGLVEITARTAADIQPPLYYYLLHAWIGLFGAGERALRALSVLFGVLTVPLMYAIGWQLFRSRLAGLMAALLVSLSPPHLWYSQEVRMYTLLTFLGVLSSYLLLLIVQLVSDASSPGAGRLEARSAQSYRREFLLWIGYAVTGVAAVYTHYFAFFLLAFHGVYLLLVWMAQGFRPQRLPLGGLVCGVGILLAYLPWLPTMLTRYGADASYWQGQLELGDVLREIAVFYVGGESISERAGLLLAIGYGFILLLCFLSLLGRSGREVQVASRGEPGQDNLPRTTSPAAQHSVWFLLFYLLLPPALILLLSYNAPKFNARYVMTSHPALLLILAGGLAELWRWRKGFLGKLMRWTVAALALAFVLGVSAYADYQAYGDRAFARADFRGAARYIRRHIESDEVVILCSGHMFPVFDYYAPGVERYLLPGSPTLDTTRTLDYSIASDLNRWLAGRGGVWLVLWQDEVVDPAGYLTTMLAGVGTAQPVTRSFSQLRLRHYRLPVGARFAERPAIAHPIGVNFGDRLRLLGYNQSGSQEVTLFWEALQPLKRDYRVSLLLRDTKNQIWGRWDGRPAAYAFPTERWRVGQIVPGRYELVPLPGTPPGDYGLDVGVYTEEDLGGLDILDSAGAPQGKRAMLGAVTLSVPAVTLDAIEVPHPVQIALGDGLSIAGWDLSPSEGQPGDRLLLNLIWSVDSQPQSDYGMRVLFADCLSQTFEVGVFPPTSAWHPTSTWSAGQAWRGQSSFRLPIQAQPGMGSLAVQLVDGSGRALHLPATLTTVQVLPTARMFAPPRPQIVRETDFDGKVILVGADMVRGPVRAGDNLAVTLYWQSRQDMDVPYTVFVHLVGVDGQLVSGDDGQPARGGRPTTGWVPGEFIVDPHDLPIPSDLPAGFYVIEVGLYDAGVPGMPRLPILGDEGQEGTDRVIFGPVQVIK